MLNNDSMNVLSNTYRDKFLEQDTIDTVANMINTSGANRAQRRRLEKSLAKTNKLSAKVHDKIEHKIYNKYKDITDEDFTHFNAILALVMYEDYRWREDETHDQITSLLERFQHKMQKYKDLNYTTDKVCKEVEELTGIVLISDIKAKKQNLNET